jgi:hypothetical protein
MQHLVPGYPAIPLMPLRPRVSWLGGLRWPKVFKLERDGLLRLTRIDGEIFIAADDAQLLIDLCRSGSPAMRLLEGSLGISEAHRLEDATRLLGSAPLSGKAK